MALRTKLKAVPSEPQVNLDPLDVNGRLYKQCGQLLDQLENAEGHVTLKERIAALVAIGRIQTIFVGLRRERGTDDHSGATVRKYASAFKDDNGRRAPRQRATEPEPDDWFERAGVGGSDDGDDEPDTA